MAKNPTYLMTDTPNLPPLAVALAAIPNIPWLLPLIWDKVPLPTFLEVALPLGAPPVIRKVGTTVKRAQNIF